MTQTHELLAWVESHRATYAETMAAWTSHCPRLTIWEDALIDGLVRVERTAAGESRVGLTDRGRAALAQAR